MTSPPYWGLRDYCVEGQIGLEKHPHEYIEKLANIFHDLKRVLKPHGSLYLNLGDTYCSTKGTCVNAGGGQSSIRQSAYTRLAGNKNPNRMLKPDGQWLQPKQLLMIPARVAIALQENGWILRNDIIWYKPNGLPSSVKDRLANKYEHVFHFVKSRTYYYDLDAIRVPHKRGTPRAEYDFERMMKGGERFNGKWGKAGTQKAFVAGNVLGKKPGDVVLSRDKTAALRKINSMRNPPEPTEPDAFHPLGKNPGDFIELEGSTYPDIDNPEYCYRSAPRKRSERKQNAEAANSSACSNADISWTINVNGKNRGGIYRSDEEELGFWKQVVLEEYAKAGKAGGKRFSGKHQALDERSPLFRIALNSGQMRNSVYYIIDTLNVSRGLKQKLKNWWHDHSGHCLGSNPGDFWRITTKPFPKAHFAVYPEELCIRPILSSCPRLACRECSKPPHILRSHVGRNQGDWRTEARRKGLPVDTVVAHLGGGHTGLSPGYRERHVVGWKDCGCNAGVEPGIVFDPFAGTGTTLLVAKKLGRRWLGCELNPKFVKMANQRISNNY
ncbi:site-specific DNA-methyltransferase [Acidobacteriia bacterium AH_259_A11_L15]|nr:site-specific DNA-methyltransferase [Acidobacteriia bacterium AH_259_A11_L15]